MSASRCVALAFTRPSWTTCWSFSGPVIPSARSDTYADDRIEWCAQLVRHDRQEVGLRAARGLRVPARRALAHQARRALGVRSATLAHDRREHEARERRDPHERTEMREAEPERVTRERPDTATRPPHGERRDHHGAGRGTSLLEAERGPDEQGKRDIHERSRDAALAGARRTRESRQCP